MIPSTPDEMAGAAFTSIMILNRSTPSPFHRDRAWHIHKPLDIEAMPHSDRVLVGEHDFSSFPRRRLRRATSGEKRLQNGSLYTRGDLLVITIEGRHSCANGAQHRWHTGRSGPWLPHAESLVNCSMHATVPRPVPPRRQGGYIWSRSNTMRLNRCLIQSSARVGLH